MFVKKGFRSLIVSVLLMTGSLFATVGFANCSDAALGCLDTRVAQALQRELKHQGFYNGRITGKYDNSTEKAVISFSKKKKIEYDSQLNKELVNALWGVDIDYENATTEERINFLKKLKF